ncbi:MAG: hypothetical protein SFY32_17085 [Bacteroidota bacterium]|nr:hypothetical protein [Bacteroidota bacterium]
MKKSFYFISTIIILLTFSCSKKEEVVNESMGHVVPGTKCFVDKIEWRSTFEDNKHYKIYYNDENLISKISNLDTAGVEDTLHYSECFYDKGKIQKIIYTHYENAGDVKIPRINIRSFEYFENGLVKAVNINAQESNMQSELIKCVYTYDDAQEITSRVCKGTMGTVQMKDSTVFVDYTGGRPTAVIEYETEKDASGNYSPWRMQNEYKYTYDQNANLIKKEFRRDTTQPFEIKYTATYDLNQPNPIAEILHIIDEITLSWHENPNMHTRDIDKNFRTSLNHYVMYSEKGPDGKRKTVSAIQTDSLTASTKNDQGLVTYKEYTHKLNNGKNDFNEQSSIKINYICK